MLRWEVLNFDFPDELPFDMLQKRFGDNAEIYTIIVGDAPKHQGYTRNVVSRYACSEREYLQKLWELCRSYGDYLLWQPVLPEPRAPKQYRICLPLVCSSLRRGPTCEYGDNRYCLKHGKCAHQQPHPEFSYEA